MSPTLNMLENTSVTTQNERLLHHRLGVVEELLEVVLQQECGQELVALLRQLRSMCSPEGQAPRVPEAEVLKVVEKLDLNEAIRAARAFALYFQLINIVEQHYEQQESISRTHPDSPPDPSVNSDFASRISGESFPTSSTHVDARSGPSERTENHLYGLAPAPARDLGTFHWLFPKLRSLNVPPQQIQRLIDQLDIKLVFTAHPTEIVRQTIRDKQRRIAGVLEQLDYFRSWFGQKYSLALGNQDAARAAYRRNPALVAYR